MQQVIKKMCRMCQVMGQRFGAEEIGAAVFVAALTRQAMEIDVGRSSKRETRSKRDESPVKVSVTTSDGVDSSDCDVCHARP